MSFKRYEPTSTSNTSLTHMGDMVSCVPTDGGSLKLFVSVGTPYGTVVLQDDGYGSTPYKYEVLDTRVAWHAWRLCGIAAYW